MRICVITPFTGLAGDMLLAALVGAGAPLEEVRAAVASSGLTGWELRVETLLTHGLTAARAVVDTTDDATSRHAAELVAMAAKVRPAPVAERAVAALRAIAEVEGRLHGESPDRVHLHELGGHDTLVDVIGVLAALHALDVSTVYCHALPIGTGSVRTAHGLLPVPAPATAALLQGARTVGSGSTVSIFAFFSWMICSFCARAALQAVSTGTGPSAISERATRPYASRSNTRASMASAERTMRRA